MMAARQEAIRAAVDDAVLSARFGHITAISGPVVRVAFAGAQIGDVFRIVSGHSEDARAEVVATHGDEAVLCLFGSARGLRVGDHMEAQGGTLEVPFGPGLAGAVLDGFGRPFSGGALPMAHEMRPAKAPAVSPLARPLVSTPMYTGLRAIDAALTLGRGQRIGVFGPPGTGKTMLLTKIAADCDADTIVIGLVGERGREVQEFLARHLPPETRDRVVVVASTSDRPAMERVYAAHVATTIAEGFRDMGQSVLLMIDSMTRVARALREVGLAAGEPPTRRGYPASVYPALPQIIERAGRTERGDITAIYTVLVEGDGANDPIAEETKSLTDGHIMLSPRVAAAGRYPAIDIQQSLSRIMGDIVDAGHLALAAQLRATLAKYAEIEILIQIGEYKPGSDAEADLAIARMPALTAFLAQSQEETSAPEETRRQLEAIFG